VIAKLAVVALTMIATPLVFPPAIALERWSRWQRRRRSARLRELGVVELRR